MNQEPIWITKKIALAIHSDQILQHGGSYGARDEGLLESALDRPKNLYVYNPQANLLDLSASLGLGIAKNHPFIDGNKRTSFLLMYVFLSLNGLEIETSEEDVVMTMVGVADGSVSEKSLSLWLEKVCRTHQ